MKPLATLNLARWIEDHRSLLRPPVGNKRIFPAGEFIVMAVGGPNSRKDFHVDPAEEVFYQLEGDMLLKTVQDGHVVDVPIRAGELLLLPPRVPHSPQRFTGTVGLVIERERRPGEYDGLQWYCENCQSLLYEETFQLTDIETQFPDVFARFFANLDARRCRQCGTVMEPPR